MASQLEKNRRAIDEHRSARAWFSPAVRGLDRALERSLRAHVRGSVLDVGCGNMPYRGTIEAMGGTYSGLDVEARTTDVAYVCSADDMHPVEDASFETVVCSEVLEHVREPARVVGEITRVLRPGGTVVLSVPFLGRLHEEPHDYFRYTEHGIRSLCESNGLALQSIEITGSIASFFGHQLSTALVGGSWHVPVLRWLLLGANIGLVVAPARLFDALLGPGRRLMPLGYVAVATKV